MATRPSTLKALVLRGSMLTLAGHGAGQLIRLGRNLILTRLLFPEAFGLMTLVWIVMYGLEMLSDVGIGSAIVRDERGEDRDFQNTAWTMQVARGVLLWAASYIIAEPMSQFYHEPDLAQLIPVAGAAAFINGFNSTSLHTCRRRMHLEPLVALELATEVVGVLAVVAWALVSPSVWALVGGSLVGRTFFAVASHKWLPGLPNRARWQLKSVRTLVGFGRWIYLSSVFHFLAVQGDRLLLGRFLAISQLGVYSVAATLVEALHSLVMRVSRGVLFPAYGRVVRDDTSRLRRISSRARFGLDVFLVCPIAAVAISGKWIVEMLYDERYHQAGWMFQILCVRLLLAITSLNGEACLVALGHPRYAFLMSMYRALWLIVAMPVSWHFWRIEGVVWAVVSSYVPAVAVAWLGMHRHRLLSLHDEFRTIGFAAAGAALGAGLLTVLT